MMSAKEKIKQISAFLAALLLIAFSAFGPFFGITAYAALKDPVADTIYDVVDGSEQTSRNFSISYEITSGHRLENAVTIEKTGCEGDMKAKAGDTITINYSLCYPQNTDYNTYTNLQYKVYAESTSYDNGYEGEKTVLVDDTFAGANGSSGTLSVDVPKNSDTIFISISSSYDWEYTVAGTTQGSGVMDLFFFIHGEVEGGVEDTPVVQEVEQHAETESGEDEGTEVAEEIVEEKTEKKEEPTVEKRSPVPRNIGIAVGGALIGGGLAGALVGGGAEGSSKQDTRQNKKSYKMYVSKDFGDAIRKGAAPVQVSAKMMEIREGGRKSERLDLTRKITVSGEHIVIGSTSMPGSWMTAQVYAEANTLEDEGTVIFTFTGEGGVFRNRVTFRLVGNPYLVFPDMPSYNASMLVRVIANDPDTYSCRFYYENAVSDPKKITFSESDRFEIKYRKSDTDKIYFADVTFKQRVECPQISSDTLREYISIQAEFENGDVVAGGFYVEIWPEGLSLTSRHVRDDHLVIDTVPEENVGDLDYKIRPTGFKVRMCYKDAGGKVPVFLTGEELKPKFSGLYEVEKYGNTFKENFKYSINTQFNEYGFEPEYTLPTIKEPYEAKMDMECEAGGQNYSMTIPLRFIGEKPLLPSNAEWQAVYQKLKRAIFVFGVGSDPEVKSMLRNVRTASAADLEYIRYWIILTGKHFYETQSREYADIDKTMTNYIVVGSAMVKIGDKAVEVAIRLKWPNADSAIIAAFVNPWKNALAEWIGQYVASFSFVDLAEGDPESFEPVKTLLASFESGFSEILTSESVLVEPKTTGKLVSFYLLICFAKHYFYGEDGEKGDIFKSVISSLGDLTLVKLKEFIKGAVEWGEDKISAFAGFVCKHLGSALKNVGLTKGQELAKLAYEHQVRMAIQNQGELSKQAFDSAKQFGETVKNQYLDGVGKTIGEYAKMGVDFTEKYVLAAVINYLVKGTKKENDALGVETGEVIAELIPDRADDALKFLSDKLKERYNIDIYKCYHETVETLDVSVRLDGELMIMVFGGYTVEINIVENAGAIFDMAYDICFGWMEDLWNSMQSNPPTSDPRDDLSDDITLVDRMTERMHELGSSADIRYTGT